VTRKNQKMNNGALIGFFEQETIDQIGQMRQMELKNWSPDTKSSVSYG
jgi:hypothetical protein